MVKKSWRAQKQDPHKKAAHELLDYLRGNTWFDSDIVEFLIGSTSTTRLRRMLRELKAMDSQ